MCGRIWGSALKRHAIVTKSQYVLLCVAGAMAALSLLGVARLSVQVRNMARPAPIGSASGGIV